MRAMSLDTSFFHGNLFSTTAWTMNMHYAMEAYYAVYFWFERLCFCTLVS